MRERDEQTPRIYHSKQKVSFGSTIICRGSLLSSKHACKACLFMLRYNSYMFLISGDRGALREPLLKDIRQYYICYNFLSYLIMGRLKYLGRWRVFATVGHIQSTWSELFSMSVISISLFLALEPNMYESKSKSVAESVLCSFSSS